MSTRRLDHRASWTAQVCAAQRAAETMQSPRRRRLNDPYASHFVQHPALRAALAHRLTARAFIALLDHQMPGVHDFVVLRVRYVDTVIGAAASDGIDQLVLLGAGFDTTSFRLPTGQIAVFEVDAPATLADKQTLADRHPTPNRTDTTRWVPCDFEYDNLTDRLLESGFDPGRPSAIVWIGVSMFLTKDAITTTLADLAELCAPTSRLVFDYIDPDVVTGESRVAGARSVARTVARKGEPYRTGFTSAEAAQLVAEHGFSAAEHLRTPELSRRYAPASCGTTSSSDWLAITSARRT